MICQIRYLFTILLQKCKRKKACNRIILPLISILYGHRRCQVNRIISILWNATFDTMALLDKLFSIRRKYNRGSEKRDRYVIECLSFMLFYFCMVWHVMLRLTHGVYARAGCPDFRRALRGPSSPERWRTRSWQGGEHMTARGAGSGRRRPRDSCSRHCRRKRGDAKCLLIIYIQTKLVHCHIPLHSDDCQLSFGTSVHLYAAVIAYMHCESKWQIFAARLHSWTAVNSWCDYEIKWNLGKALFVLSFSFDKSMCS